MGGTGKRASLQRGRRQTEEAAAARVEDDDYEDGDIATPKRDRTVMATSRYG